MKELNYTTVRYDPILQSSISNFEKKCEQRKIESIISMEQNVSIDFINDEDKHLFFTTLLNNAIKTTERCKEQRRKIYVRFYMFNKYNVVFRVENTYADMVCAKGKNKLKKLARLYGGYLGVTKDELCESFLMVSCCH